MKNILKILSVQKEEYRDEHYTLDNLKGMSSGGIEHICQTLSTPILRRVKALTESTNIEKHAILDAELERRGEAFNLRVVQIATISAIAAIISAIISFVGWFL